MFIQHLADASHTQAKLERKPRRNIQYKDVGTFPPSRSCTPCSRPSLLTDTGAPANAVSLQDNLEFLEDIIPKTVPYRKIKAAAKETQARLRGEKPIDELLPDSSHAASATAPLANGIGAADAAIVNGEGLTFRMPRRADDRADDPNDQLELEMRQAELVGPSGDPDVNMSG